MRRRKMERPVKRKSVFEGDLGQQQQAGVNLEIKEAKQGGDVKDLTWSPVHSYREIENR